MKRKKSRKKIRKRWLDDGVDIDNFMGDDGNRAGT